MFKKKKKKKTHSATSLDILIDNTSSTARLKAKHTRSRSLGQQTSHEYSCKIEGQSRGGARCVRKAPSSVRLITQHPSFQTARNQELCVDESKHALASEPVTPVSLTLRRLPLVQRGGASGGAAERGRGSRSERDAHASVFFLFFF